MLAVIIRELRIQARQPLTYWLRMVGALSVAGAVGLALWKMLYPQEIRWMAAPTGFTPVNQIQSFGIALFGKINLFIFAAIWIFVPLATADAISRERREGTLPLLYLTRLRSRGIVVGKTFVHLLRACTLFLTVVPWLMLSLVFGGVGMRDVWMALMLDFSAILLAQAAGLMASTIPRDWLKSVILSALFALISLVILLWFDEWVLGVALQITGATTTRVSWSSWGSYSFTYRQGLLAQLAQGIEFITNGSLDDFHLTYAYGYGYNSAATAWQELWTGLNRGGRQFWWWGTAGILCGALLILLGAIKLAARRVEISWRDAPASTAVLALRRKLLAPCFQTNWLRHRLSRALNANPIGWLQQYSPSARLVKWGWCAFVVLVETFLSANDRDIYLAQEGIGLLLLLGLTFSATGSFRNELESGAFELLLVTPLREWQIIAGRVQGLWRQFLPAAGLYAAGYIYLTSGWEGEDYFVQAELGLLRFAVEFLTLPFIGLYFSLKRWNFFVAWITASLCGLAPGAIGHVLAPNGGLTFAVQAGIAFAAGMLLLKRLENREFLEAAAA